MHARQPSVDDGLDAAIMGSPAASSAGLVAGQSPRPPSAHPALAMATNHGGPAARQPIPANRMAIMRAIEEVNAAEMRVRRTRRAKRALVYGASLLVLAYLIAFAFWRVSGSRSDPSNTDTSNEAPKKGPRSFRALEEALEREREYFEDGRDGALDARLPQQRRVRKTEGLHQRATDHHNRRQKPGAWPPASTPGPLEENIQTGMWGGTPQMNGLHDSPAKVLHQQPQPFDRQWPQTPTSDAPLNDPTPNQQGLQPLRLPDVTVDDAQLGSDIADRISALLTTTAPGPLPSVLSATP